jgi:hypothetical protein
MTKKYQHFLFQSTSKIYPKCFFFGLKINHPATPVRTCRVDDPHLFDESRFSGLAAPEQ